MAITKTMLSLVLVAFVVTPGYPVGPDRPAMVEVPGGRFFMGSQELDPDHLDDEINHEVVVDGFLIGKYEVTVGEFRDFIADTGYRTSAELSAGTWWYSTNQWLQDRTHDWENPGFSQSESCPVTSVSWLDTIAFCNWRSIKDGYAPVYKYRGLADYRTWPSSWNLDSGGPITMDSQADGYRLPTEAEWEFACRGGNLATTGAYAGADDAELVGWYRPNADAGTHPVGQKPANSLGLHDMAGNVGEWCWDWYGTYGAGTALNPRGPDGGVFRVTRGGAWFSGADSFLRSASRSCATPEYSCTIFGFRLARTDSIHNYSSKVKKNTALSSLQATGLFTRFLPLCMIFAYQPS